MTDETSRQAHELVAGLDLEEKASLTSGASFWGTKAVERAGVQPILLTDGPHGVRLQQGDADHLGLNASVPATCFPPAVALGATFDAELVERVGVALGEEAQSLGVGVLLGPGINIKRSPLCGRNFEYFSEDPLVSGVLGAAHVRGVQSQGVGASLKHFAVNNQETDRMRISADVDPRPLREIYLRAFQRVVQETQPWTVMSSYNRINGVYAGESPWLLTEVLREEWGFDGLVVSDWGAVADRAAALAAGLDLEMPATGGRTDAGLVAGVRDGSVDEAVLDLAAVRAVELAQRVAAGRREGAEYDADAHHELAREVAGRAAVLLRNEGGLLPLAEDLRVAVIGEFARTPRFQGAGSSRINPTRVDNALDAIRAIAGQERVVFAPGFTLDAADDRGLVDEAAAAAAGADVVLLFLGLPDAVESEGLDRADLTLPPRQLEVLEAVVAANPAVVVVLSNGGVVELPFAGRVPAILEGWLGGQASGSAIADVLYGRVNPSGRLAETVPVTIGDTPAALDFPGEFGHVRYGEGLFVGYRWYDARGLRVQFPFGHGLSYTTFEYSALEVSADEAGIHASVTVTNTGDRAGREVVQLYTGLPGSRVQRAPRALGAFANVPLEAGESATVALLVPREELAYWDLRVPGWVVEAGDYDVAVGASSRDLRLHASVAVAGDIASVPITAESTLGEIMADPAAGVVVRQALQQVFGGDNVANASPAMQQVIRMLPAGRLPNFSSAVTPEQLHGLVAAAEGARQAGLAAASGAAADGPAEAD